MQIGYLLLKSITPLIQFVYSFSSTNSIFTYIIRILPDEDNMLGFCQHS